MLGGEAMRGFLKVKREEKGLTQLLLSQFVGVSEQYIYLIESGKRRPSYEVATKIASILDIDWRLFFEDNKKAQKRKEAWQNERTKSL